jgi:hypothetical protein
MRLPLGLLLLLSLPAAAQDRATVGDLDSAFSRFPVSTWFEDRIQAPIRWTLKVHPAQLSLHQRLVANIEVQIDGSDVAARRGKGGILIFVQLNDAEGRPYQQHGSIDLEKVEEGIKASNLVYTQSVFVLPGEYRVQVAIYCTATEEHGSKKDRLKVPALRNDPLPEAWRNLPPVELRPLSDAPDVWYAPGVRGRLHLPVAPRRPVQVELVVNLTASEIGRSQSRGQSRNLSMLLPAMKTLAQIGLPVNVTLIDLMHHRVVFEQKAVRRLHWAGIRTGLAEAEPGKIDVKSLGDRKLQAQFFVDEVQRRAGPGKVLIVVSGPVLFEAAQEASPAAAAPDTRLYYLRFYGIMTPGPILMSGGSPRRRPGMGIPMGGPAPGLGDQLAGLLKPMTPRVHDVQSAAQFRKALAGMLSDLAAF